MAEKGEVYRCEKCRTVVAVMVGGDADLVCCGEEMQRVGESESREFLSGLPKIGAAS